MTKMTKPFKFSTLSLLACVGLTSIPFLATAQDKQPAAAGKPAKLEVPAPPKPDPTKSLAEQIDMKQVSYIIGRQFGDNLKRQFVEPEIDDLIRGIKSALEGKDTEIGKEDGEALMAAFRPIHGAHFALQRKLSAFEVDAKGWAALAAKNKTDGGKFLADNGKREGVKTMPSGLQYEILKAGSGQIPKLSDQVTAVYKGTLIDGTVFDDSKGTARPFGVSRVVKAWQEALQMMPEGSKWKIYVPSDLGYGPEGNRPPIGPNATLIFEMELTSIQRKPQVTTPPVGIDIPPRKGASTTPAKPRKRITATTPPVTVPIPKKVEPKPVPAPKPEEKK